MYIAFMAKHPITVLIVIALSLSVPSQITFAQANNDSALSASSRSFDDLHPRSKQILIKRAAEIVRTPDGQLWDGWGEFEYRRAYNRSVRKIRTTTRSRTNGWTVPTSSSTKWELVESNDSEAWEIKTIHFHGLEALVSARQAPPLWGRMQPDIDASPTPSVVYVDEIDRLPLFRDQDFRHLTIERAVSSTNVEVKISNYSGSHNLRRQQFVVHLPDEKYVHPRGYLSGKFILYSDGTIDENTKARVWQYIPYQNAAITPKELHDEIASGNAVLRNWSYRKLGGAVLWESSKIDLEYRIP